MSACEAAVVHMGQVVDRGEDTTGLEVERGSKRRGEGGEPGIDHQAATADSKDLSGPVAVRPCSHADWMAAGMAVGSSDVALVADHRIGVAVA